MVRLYPSEKADCVGNGISAPEALASFSSSAQELLDILGKTSLGEVFLIFSAPLLQKEEVCQAGR